MEHVLVAVDQFPQSGAALARAIEIGRAHDARITVVHIVEALGAQGSTDFAETHLIEEQALLLARQRVEEAIGMLDLSRVKVDIHVDAGSVSARVIEISNHLGVDLIVLRAHQRRSIREKLIGSTADRIVRATPSSVLVVKRPVERAYQNAVIAVDLSDDSESAAVSSVQMCPDMRLQLVHVTHLTTQFELGMVQVGNSQAEIAAFRRKLTDRAADRMRRLATRFAGREPPVHTRVIEGNPAKSLVYLTRSPRVDLIAVGPYEHGVIRLALLGSITQHLLREGACDVLITRPRTTGN